MLSIIISEIRDRKWSLVAYMLASLLMIWLYVATFRSSQSSAQQLQELVKTYPKGFLDAFGLSDLGLSTIEGYLNAKHFSLLWPLLAIILALSRAGKQIAGEIQEGTMGLLLSLPLKRWQIFTSKYIVGLITVILFTAISLYGVVPFAAAYNIPSHLGVLTSAWILSTLFMLSVYSLALAVSASVSEGGKVYAVMSAVLLVTYAANLVSLLVDKYSWLKYLSLFYYFDTHRVLTTGQLSGKSVLVFGGLIVASTIFAGWMFSRRDVSV